MKRKGTDRVEFKKFVDITGIGLLILCLLMALTQHAHAKDFSSSQDFVQKATIGGMFEVKSSELALQRSQNADVRAFAQRMIDDHTKANDELKSTVADSEVNAATIHESLDRPHQKMLDKLKADSDKNFDRDYISDQKKAHKEAVSLYKDYAKSGDDEVLKSFASETLPTLEDHKKEIDNLKI